MLQSLEKNNIKNDELLLYDQAPVKGPVLNQFLLVFAHVRISFNLLK